MTENVDDRIVVNNKCKFVHMITQKQEKGRRQKSCLGLCRGKKQLQYSYNTCLVDMAKGLASYLGQ